MSRSKQRGKQFKEWWGKRPFAYHPVSNNSKVDKFWKRLLHKKERREGKTEMTKQLNKDD